MNLGEKIGLIILGWQTSFRMLKKHPLIILPYIFLSLIEATLLILLYLAPQPPVSTFLAPPIKAFFGEAYLHYPSNLLILPALFDYSLLFLTIIFGVMINGMVVGMVSDAHEKKGLYLFANLAKAIKKYPALILLSLFMAISAYIIFIIPKMLILGFYTHQMETIFHLSQWRVLQIALGTSFFFFLILDLLFAYSIPVVIIENRGIFSAIKRSFSVNRGILFSTFFLVLIPTIFNCIILLLKLKILFFMEMTFPEIVLFILGSSIFIKIFTEYLRVSSIATIFLWRKENETT
ncbi:MAG: hypothetical protein V2A53_01315 [bacterium]